VLALAGTLVASRTAAASAVTVPVRRFAGVLHGGVAVAASVALLAMAMPLLLAEHDVAAAARAGSNDAALEQLDAARRWNPVDAQIERALAARLDAAGRGREASQAMRRQLELDRASWVSWVLVARHEAQIGHPAMARRYALEARLRNPLEPSLRDPRRIAAPAVLEDPVTRDAQRAAA
jgi:Flp pilus assembly protein TadD